MAGKNRRRKGRSVNGILLLDKPAGVSSNHALQAVKRYFKAAKAGHTGSLDPIATGMLPICFGEATKVCAFLLDSNKSYYFKAKLGIQTTTGDIEGEVVSERVVPKLTRKKLEKILAEFLGEISQVPPMYSALHHNGKRLYQLAREGIVVDRPARQITIHEINYIGHTEDELEVQVSCSKGTYIRTLVEDIGEKLGCGAHVCELRRTSVSPYAAESIVSMDDLTELNENFEKLDAFLLPIDSALQHWPEIELTSDSAYYIKQGQAVRVSNSPTSGLVRLYSPDDGFIGLGEIKEDGNVAPKRMFFIE